MQLESIALDDVCNPAAVCYLSPSVVKAYNLCLLWEAVLIPWPRPSTLRDLRGKPGGTAPSHDPTVSRLKQTETEEINHRREGVWVGFEAWQQLRHESIQ